MKTLNCSLKNLVIGCIFLSTFTYNVFANSQKTKTIPGSFSLYQPVANSIVYTRNNTSSIELKWGISNNATSYKVFLYNHQNFIIGTFSNGIVAGIDTVRYNLPVSFVQNYFNTRNVPLGDSLSYTWRVSAYSSSDSLLSSNELNIWFVNLEFAGQPFLRPFNLVSPSGLFTFNTQQTQPIAFTWRSSHPNATYKLFVDTTRGNFSNSLLPILDTMIINDTVFLLQPVLVNNLLQSISSRILDTFDLKWHVKAFRNGVELFAVRELTIRIKIENTVGLNQFGFNEFKIYPNPAYDKFYIESYEKINQVQIFDFYGRLILNQEEIKNNEISLDNFSHGMYIIQIDTDKGNGFVKLLKN